MICQDTSSHPPPSPSVWPLLSLLVDVIVPLCSHFTMAILHLPGQLRLSVSPSACHVNVCFCVLCLSIRFNLNWELGMQNGMSEIEPYLSASTGLPQYFPRSIHVTSEKPVSSNFNHPLACLFTSQAILEHFQRDSIKVLNCLQSVVQNFSTTLNLKPFLQESELFFSSFISKIYRLFPIIVNSQVGVSGSDSVEVEKLGNRNQYVARLK